MRALSIITSALIIAAALSVSALTFVGNGWFWWRAGEGAREAQTIGVVFSAVCGVLVLAVPAWLSARGYRWRDRPKLACVAAIALLFNVWSGLGYVGLSRELAATERRAGRASADAARDDLPGLGQQLAALPASRAAALVRADVASAETLAGQCRGSASAACQRLARLQLEFATAVERDRLETRLTGARALAAATPPSDARPEVAFVARALASLGMSISDDVLAAAWAVLQLILFELVPVAVLAELVRRSPAPAPAAAPKPVAPKAAPPVRPATVAPATPAAPTVLDVLRAEAADAHGWIRISQRSLGNRLSVSATTAGRQLHALVAKKALEMQRDDQGLAVRLCP